MTDTNLKEHCQPVIFIAEDIPRNLQVLCNMLTKANYKIAAAANGKKALEMIPDAKPDLVLLDVMMPEMDGFEVAESLKQNPATKEIPIIFLTAKADATDIVKGFGLGAVDYVTKPFNGAELLSRVKTHLELKFAREELKQLSATKDKLFSIIAHDIRNPLQNSLLYSDSLENDYDRFDDEKRKKYIHKVFNSTHQISALLKNLLAWSRSQMELIVPLPEQVDLSTLAAEAIDLAKINADKKEITVLSRIEPGTMAFADKNMIPTVLRNLLSNSVKFTNTGGNIKIKADKKDGCVEVAVCDDGVGINEEEIAGIFRIDHQKTKLGTNKEKGTGLGLILCKEFVEKNKGTIAVESTPGKGSCFKFTLPLKETGESGTGT
ncbi:MAG: hybrid sensor histidine kinase/response regulator [bacterium]|nr:hybrid sensor histidine kinase/response regulator [bacterium]